MRPEELRDCLRVQPFEPFNIVLTDGVKYEIQHPDLLWVGARVAYVGLVGKPGITFFERSVRLDLLHVIRVEPVESRSVPPNNGETAT